MRSMFARFEQIRTEELRFLDPEDRRRLLMAARTRAEIDCGGELGLPG